ncbi:MAG: GLPGLI family protein [Culturomica sp.]|jgi:GLPGLI family protein|nr:GLPGLI family protein [Culturomica sp.]
MRILFSIILFSIGVITSGFAQKDQIVTVNVGKQVSINTGIPVEQKEIGKTVMEFMYDYSYLTDTTDITSKVKDRMVLQVTYSMSKFTSYRMMQIDSLIGVSTAEQIKANPGRYVGGETSSIYKNYPSGKFTTTDKIATDWFIFEEDIPMQEWIMTNETKEILGYNCNSAKCHFRGRDYIAYYTDKIPVADGPWKFGGLPGFIMEVHDKNNYYSFICVGINSKATSSITIPKVQYNRTTRGKFYKTKYKYDIDPAGYMEAVSGVHVIVTTPDGIARNDMMQVREPKYNYIECDWR